VPQGEPVGTVHRPAGRDNVADDRRRASRVLCLHAGAGGAPAAGRLPDHYGEREYAVGVGAASFTQIATREDRVCVLKILGGESSEVTPVGHAYSGGNVVFGTSPGQALTFAGCLGTGTGSSLTPRWREMDSNFWYRGTKAVDFRSIPGVSAGLLNDTT
jgi:hypothetical protein